MGEPSVGNTNQTAQAKPAGKPDQPPKTDTKLSPQYTCIAVGFQKIIYRHENSDNRKIADDFIREAADVFKEKIGRDQKMAKLNGLLKKHFGIETGFNKKSFEAFLVDPKTKEELSAGAFFSGIIATVVAFNRPGEHLKDTFLNYLKGREFVVIGASSGIGKLNLDALKQALEAGSIDIFEKLMGRSLDPSSPKDPIDEILLEALQMMGQRLDKGKFPNINNGDREHFLLLVTALITSKVTEEKIRNMTSRELMYDTYGGDMIKKYFKSIRTDDEKAKYTESVVNLLNGRGFMEGKAPQKEGVVEPVPAQSPTEAKE